MLLTQQHLKDQEKFLEELTRWYVMNVGDHYGLVRKDISGKPALSLDLSLHGDLLRVEVIRCQAVTPDGGVIEINESNNAAVRTETSVDKQAVAVYLGIADGGRKQVGEPDPQEDLPRIPFLVADYVLSLGAPPNLPRGRYLQIAELTISGDEVGHSDSYYAPCQSLSADERLSQKASDYCNRLESLLSLSSRAYAAMATGRALAGEQTSLQQAFVETIWQFAYHLASTFDDFIVGRNAPHPIHLVIFFKRLFRVFSTLLNLRPGLKDYLNERFFVKQMNTDVNRFLSTVDGFLLCRYNHADLGGHVREIDDILHSVRGVMGFLAQVKPDQLGEQAIATDTLTYHGRTYRIVPQSGSRVEQVGELTYLMVDILEPCAVSDTVVLLNKDLYATGEWTSMQVRLGLNEARGLGETDPVEVDVVTFGDKVALRPEDMLRSPSVRQITLIFRGAREAEKFSSLGKMDLFVYAM